MVLIPVKWSLHGWRKIYKWRWESSYCVFWTNSAPLIWHWAHWSFMVQTRVFVLEHLSLAIQFMWNLLQTETDTKYQLEKHVVALHAVCYYAKCWTCQSLWVMYAVSILHESTCVILRTVDIRSMSCAHVYFLPHPLHSYTSMEKQTNTPMWPKCCNYTFIVRLTVLSVL